MTASTHSKMLLVSMRRFSSAVIVLLFVIFNLIFFFQENNADWDGYKEIFNDGAWLKSQGRDAGFVGLAELVRSLGGRYVDFRVILATYFLIFTVFILIKWWRWLECPAYFWGFGGLLPLMLPRFTVQVREGLAITFIMGAYGLMVGNFGVRKPFLSGVISLIIVVLAVGFIHSGLILFPLIFAAAIVVTLVERLRKREYGVVQNKINFLIVVFVVIAVASGGISGVLNSAAPDFYEGFISRETEFGVEKTLFWVIKTFVLFYLIGEASNTIGGNSWSPVLGNILRMSTRAILPGLHVLIIYLIYSSSLVIVTASANRLYSSLFFMTFAVVSLKAKKGWLFLIVLFLVIADQYRVLITNASQ